MAPSPASIPPVPTDFNAFVADTYIITNTPGINVKWDVTDQWSAILDADQSVSYYNPNDGYTDIDADVGFGGATNNYTGGLILNPKRQCAALLERLRPEYRGSRAPRPSPTLTPTA